MKPRFSWRVWRWTGAHENLFTLSPQERAIFVLFCKEAST